MEVVVGEEGDSIGFEGVDLRKKERERSGRVAEGQEEGQGRTHSNELSDLVDLDEFLVKYKLGESSREDESLKRSVVERCPPEVEVEKKRSARRDNEREGRDGLT